MVKVIESRKQTRQDKVGRVCAAENVRIKRMSNWFATVFRENGLFGRTICAVTYDWTALFCTRPNLRKTKRIASRLQQEGMDARVIIHPNPIYQSTEYTEWKKRNEGPKSAARCQSCGALATSAAICPYCHAPRKR